MSFWDIMLLDGVVGDGDMTEGFGFIIVFIVLGGFIYACMDKLTTYIVNTFSDYYILFGIAAILLTILIPILYDDNNIAKLFIQKLLLFTNILVGFTIVVLITNYFDIKIASSLYEHTLYILFNGILAATESIPIVGFFVNFILLIFAVICRVTVFVLDLVVLPFALIPFIQKITWKVLGVKFD